MNNIESKSDYHIISPVFNGEDNLELILEKAREIGYLNKITFVNDASTDNTLEILKIWHRKEGLRFINLKDNQKKEGAILSALELMNRKGLLPDKIITLDSDSFLVPRDKSESIDIAIKKASIYMDQMNLVGITFNMEPILGERATFLEKIQYPEYTGLWFWHRLSAKQNKIWVLNGPGAMFRSEALIDTLKTMLPDFETGDFLITVNLMKKGCKIGYYEMIQLFTSVPSTPFGLFKQRRRWERGTLKVLSWNISFYLDQTIKLNLIGAQLILYLWIYFGWLVFIFNWKLDRLDISENILLLGSFWLLFNVCINLLNKSVLKYADIRKIILYAPIWLILWPLIVMPARITGLLDFFKYYLIRISSGQNFKMNSNIDQVKLYHENDI